MSSKRKLCSRVSFVSMFLSFLLSLLPNHSLHFPGLLVEATELTSLSPRVVFTKQGPVQGFLGPGNVGAHYQPQTDGSYTFRHYTGRPVVEVRFSVYTLLSKILNPMLGSSTSTWFLSLIIFANISEINRSSKAFPMHLHRWAIYVTKTPCPHH